jgi:hypothetical protein
MISVLLSGSSSPSAPRNRLLVCTPSNTAVDEILYRLRQNTCDDVHSKPSEGVDVGIGAGVDADGIVHAVDSSGKVGSSSGSGTGSGTGFVWDDEGKRKVIRIVRLGESLDITNPRVCMHV